MSLFEEIWTLFLLHVYTDETPSSCLYSPPSLIIEEQWSARTSMRLNQILSTLLCIVSMALADPPPPPNTTVACDTNQKLSPGTEVKIDAIWAFLTNGGDCANCVPEGCTMLQRENSRTPFGAGATAYICSWGPQVHSAACNNTGSTLQDPVNRCCAGKVAGRTKFMDGQDDVPMQDRIYVTISKDDPPGH